MHFKFVCLLVTFITIIVIKPAYSENEKSLSATTLLNFAPHVFPIPESDETLINETIAPGTNSKRLQGYAWDVFREAFHAMGYTIQLKIRPWRRCLEEVATGKTDIVFPASWNKERDRIFDFSEDYINMAFYVMFYPTREAAQHWKGLESLKGKTILTISGWTYGSEFDSNDSFNKLSVDSIEQAIGMLNLGRGNAIAGYLLVHGYQIAQLGFSDQFFPTNPFGSSKEYALTQKGNPRGVQLLDTFVKGKKKISENGILTKINQKWMKQVSITMKE